MSTSAFPIRVPAPLGATVTVSVTRTDTNAVILAATAMTATGGGNYQLIPPFTDPAAGLTYAVTWIVNGVDVISLQQRGGGGATGYYATQQDLELEFGSTAVASWANLDGQSGPANQAIVLSALLSADAITNSFFAGSKYPVPMVLGSVSKPVVTAWAVAIAGERLYHNRGQETVGAGANQYSEGLAKTMKEMLNVRESSRNKLIDAVRTNGAVPFVGGFDPQTGQRVYSSTARCWYGNLIGWI